MEKQEAAVRGKRLVMVPYPLQGHINPMLQLATILHSKGFSITIIHPKFHSPNPAHHPHFQFLPISDGLSDTGLSPVDFVANINTFNINCKEPLRQCMEKMMKEEEKGSDDGIACIIYNELMHCTQSVAHDLKVPAINFCTTAAASMLAFAVSQLDGQGYLSFQASTGQDLAPKLHHHLKNRIISLMGNPTDARLELRAAYTAAMRMSSAIIVNTMNFLEHATLHEVQKYYPAPIFPIGPFHKFAPTALTSSLLKEDTSCIAWLNKQALKSVIYVSFGSMASMEGSEFVETAWGLANSEQPFLWVIRPGFVRGSEWIELLPDNLKEIVRERSCIVKWAPQKEVLAHGAVGGFWSHCGWNSTLESVYAGVPMICRPFFGDQGLNSSYVSHVWRVGIELEGELERGEIERAVRRLMVDKEGEEMRQRAKDLKEEAEKCLQKGGSSYNSMNELVELILSF